MKLIVDTCVWSLALRRRGSARLSPPELQLIAALQEAIRSKRAAIVGPIRQEILSGIRDKARFAAIHRSLEPFQDEEILSSDFVEAARLFNVCRGHGTQCGPIDILICAVAMRLKYRVLTTDATLLRCIEILHGEGFKI